MIRYDRINPIATQTPISLAKRLLLGDGLLNLRKNFFALFGLQFLDVHPVLIFHGLDHVVVDIPPDAADNLTHAPVRIEPWTTVSQILVYGSGRLLALGHGLDQSGRTQHAVTTREYPLAGGGQMSSVFRHSQ